MIYLNNAATGFPKLAAATQAFLADIERPPVELRSEVDHAGVVAVRGVVAEVLGVGTDQVMFASDATLALNMALRSHVEPGMRCAVDNRAHNAVLRTLHGMGADSTELELYDEADDCANSIVDAVSAIGPRVACLTHVSNVTGSVFDLEIALKDLRSAGIVTIVDASQAAGVTSLEAVAGADAIVFGSHKFLHSVPGAAVIVVNRPLRPFVFGGTGTRSASMETMEPGALWAEVGTGNAPAVCALGVAIRCWADDAMATAAIIEARVRSLWTGLGAVPGMRLIGRPPGDFRGGIVACLPAKGDPETEWVPLLRRAGVIVRGGLHCSPSIHRQFGKPRGSLRFSPSRFTTEAEIDRAVSVVHEIAWAFDAAS
jgi:cysteine desulfurase / selenocysteine lyase